MFTAGLLARANGNRKLLIYANHLDLWRIMVERKSQLSEVARCVICVHAMFEVVKLEVGTDGGHQGAVGSSVWMSKGNVGQSVGRRGKTTRVS